MSLSLSWKIKCKVTSLDPPASSVLYSLSFPSSLPCWRRGWLFKPGIAVALHARLSYLSVCPFSLERWMIWICLQSLLLSTNFTAAVFLLSRSFSSVLFSLSSFYSLSSADRKKSASWNIEHRHSHSLRTISFFFFCLRNPRSLIPSDFKIETDRQSIRPSLAGRSDGMEWVRQVIICHTRVIRVWYELKRR